MLDGCTFSFLNMTGQVRTATDWDNPELPKLWRYNLHYFDDLNAEGAFGRFDSHRKLIRRWISENAPGVGSGWEPYPISLRVVNWIMWELGGRACGYASLERCALDSLAVQVRWLVKRLEIHLLGNHLWANAKALIFAGAFFDGPEAESWLRKGVAIFERELKEQILTDGGHFERSPMYHAILLQDVLDLINLSSVTPACFSRDFVEWLHCKADRMFHWLKVMTHPDGQISFFNDAAFGIAPTYGMLTDYARRVQASVIEKALTGLTVLSDSGYVRIQDERVVLICDAGPVGPDYLPGHAHADTLSFELSLDGRRLLVNSGTSTYEANEERLRQRGTAAHNTVVVEEQDSSEVWGGFRVARRARAFDLRWGDENGQLFFEASHDGYLSSKRGVIHSRRWELSTDGLVIRDRLKGTFDSADAVYHFAPGIELEEVGKHISMRRQYGPESIFAAMDADRAEDILVEESTWHPGFGCCHDCMKVRLRFEENGMTTRLRWL